MFGQRNNLTNHVFTNSNSSTFTNIGVSTAKLAAWYKGNKTNYVVDQLGSQERENRSQNGQSGQIFPGRAIQYESSTRYSYVQDNGALDIGTPPFTIGFWIYFDVFNGFSRFLPGKYTNGSTSGEYYFTTGSNSITFNCRSSVGLVQVTNLITSVTTATWYHVIVTISDDGKVYGYLNKTLVGVNPSWSGTFGTLSNTIGFAVNTNTSVIASLSGSGYSTIRMRDMRIFRSVLTTQQRSDLYDGKYIAGFDQWWMMAGNSLTKSHSARNTGGQHLTNVAFTSPFLTGYYRAMYNEFGYAEDATFGQIPADMTNLIAGVPVNDCLGNALIFKGTAKFHLAKSGNNFSMPDATLVYSDQLEILKSSTNIISLNTWYSSGTPQSIVSDSVKGYCASRQFYKSSTKELIIMKEGQHLTPGEETALMAYLGNPTIPTSYHANTVTLFTRFTNSYSDAEKSRLDNVMRLLVSSGVYAKLEGFELPAIRGAEEQLLDWVNASFNLSALGTTGAGIPSAHVTALPYRGIAAQKDSYKNNFNPSTGTLFHQNDCFTSFKLYQDFKLPLGGNNGGIIFGVYNPGNGNWYAQFSYDPVSDLSVYFFLNSAGISGTSVAGHRINQTYIGNRTGATAGAIYVNGTQLSTFSNVSTTPTNWGALVGTVSAAAGTESSIQPNFNWVQHLAWGSSLTATQANNLAAIVDNYGDGQSALITDPWIQDSGFKYLYSDKCFIDRLGDQVIWSDYNNLYYSTDAGITIAKTMPFTSRTLGYINLVHIFDNGKIIFATSKNKIYKTTTSTFTTYSEIIPMKNGSPLTIHTPSSATYPGEYYKWLGIKTKQYLDDGSEILVWNTYCTTSLGAAPPIVWYSFGDSVKVAYEYGQNSYFTDNGTPNGGTGGNPLGDASILNWTKHGHGLRQNPQSKTDFYSMWGDFSGRAALAPVTAGSTECKFLKHVYNQGTDTWTTTILKEGTQSSRWKATSGNMPGDGFVYWSSDAGTSGTPSIELGFHKDALSTFGTGTDTQFYLGALTLPMNMFHLDSDGFLLGGGYATNTGSGPNSGFTDPYIIYSPDLITFTEPRLKIPGAPYFFEIIKLSYKKYMLNGMGFYDYYLGAFSLIVDFN